MTWGLMTKRSLCLLLAGTALLCLSTAVYAAQHAHEHGSGAAATAAPENPFKASSEFNHHLAGYGMIAIGLLVVAGHAVPRGKPLQLVWPALFILGGLFLLVWSDPEIWPRGEHGWIWMLQHGPNSRQHKAFALLLLVLGAVEYLRARGRLNRFWQVAAFPMLAVLGASILLIHQHKVGPPSPPPAAAQHQHAGTGMGMPMPAPPGRGSGHEHAMDPTVMRVEREHLWFAVVGTAVALFKFLADGGFWKRGFVPYLWPGAITVLGVLLVLYRE